MSYKIAVIQFPGLNSEYETRRALRDAGLDAEFVRWNEEARALEAYDGFVVSGGFSYEDRGRAGLIAAFDPVMKQLRLESRKGKPILGICNGAQVLVESGLVPGGKNHELLLCLAQNDRGFFYNENLPIRMDAPKARTAFTMDIETGAEFMVPVAHGEGRYTTQVSGLLEKLQKNQQIIFRYSETNPNGAVDDAAAISNGPGNVMAIMPHPERAFTAPIPGIFSSMRKYLEGTTLVGVTDDLDFQAPPLQIAAYASSQVMELYVELLITDNEAQSLEALLHQRGFQVKLRRFNHFELDPSLAETDLSDYYNSNKERIFRNGAGKTEFHRQDGRHYFLARNFGSSKGKVWEVQGAVSFEELMNLNLFANPNAEEVKKLCTC